MKKRIISALLLIVMLISLFPVQAFAAEAAENNSAVVSDVENAETQPAEEATPAEEAAPTEDDFSGEEVEIFAIPEPEYEEEAEEELEAEPIADSAGENSASISFSGAEYCADSQTWRYTIEADAGETVDLQVFPEYDGELTYVWQHFNSSSEAYLDVDAAENINALTVTLADEDFSVEAPWLCYVYAADGTTGCAEFVIGEEQFQTYGDSCYSSEIELYATTNSSYPVFPMKGVDVENLHAITYGGDGTFAEKDHYGSAYRAIDMSGGGAVKDVTPIVAVADGTVVNRADADGAVYIKHTCPLTLYDGSHTYSEWYTVYVHMNKKSIKVATGDTVSAGQQLGTMSDQGKANGAHLHFAITTKLYNGKEEIHGGWTHGESEAVVTSYNDYTISPKWLAGDFQKVPYKPNSNDQYDALAIAAINDPTSKAPKGIESSISPTPTPSTTTPTTPTSSTTPEDYLTYFAQSSKDINQTAVASAAQAWKLPWTNKTDGNLKLATVTGTITLIREIVNHVGNKWYEYQRDGTRGFVYSGDITIQVTNPYYSAPTISGRTADNAVLSTTINNPSQLKTTKGGVLLAQSSSALSDSNITNTSGYKSFIESVASGYATKTSIPCAYNLKNECGFTLQSGTTYYYRFVVEVSGGQRYYSSVYSFTTTGTAQTSSSVTFSSPKVTSLANDNAELHTTISNPSQISISAGGVWLATSEAALVQGNPSQQKLLTTASGYETKTSIPCAYNLKSECGLSLRAGTTYYYQFVAKDKSGNIYKSSIYSFTTTGSIAVSLISLSPLERTVYVGETLQISAAVSPSNAANKTINWSSDNTSAATVSSSGVVTAKAAGTARITATAADGSGVTATATITVRPVPVSSITVTPASKALYVGKTAQLSANVSPSNAANKSVSWSSTNSSVADVSSSGVVTAKAVGVTVVKATASDGSGVYASSVITVNPVPVSSIAITPSSKTLYVGETAQLSANVSPSNAANKTVNWSSNNTSVATVSYSGIVTAVGAGTAKITATAADGSGVSASISITVKPVPVSSISITPATRYLYIGRTLQLSANISPSNAANKTVTWSSSNTSVAAVSSSGLVTAKAEGDAVITAAAVDGSGISASMTISVITISGKCGDNLTWVLDESGVLTISGTGAMYDYESNVDYEAPWAEDRGSIKSVVIEPGVTSIGNCAFNSCCNMTDVTIPNTVTSIGESAFDNCSGLNSVIIPDSVMSIGDYAFSGCSGLENMTVGKGITSVGYAAFNGCDNLTDIYYCGSEEQALIISIADGNESLTLANIYALADGAVGLEISLDREYITMQIGDESVSVTAAITPAEWAGYLTWSAENPAGKEIISVDEYGEITPLAVGTAYAVATVTVNNYGITARCRVDVTESPAEDEIEISGVQLGATALTSELYSRNYAEFDILLVLPQNVSTMEAGTETFEKPEDNGIAIESARFTDTATEALFDLVVVDDRRIAVVPKIDVSDSAEVKTVKGSYTSAVAVTVGNTVFVTDAKLKLTVKKTMPKLKATVPAFNSFYSEQSNTIEITGATVTAIEPDTTKKLAVPTWLNLSEDGNGVLSIAENAQQKSASGSVYLKVYTEEWAIPASVTLSVKNTYKAPKLKLSASSVKFSSTDSAGVELQLLPSAKTETLEQHDVAELYASDGFTVEDFDTETGTFTLIVPDGDVPKKITLYVYFYDTDNAVLLTLAVSKTAPTLKLGKSTVTLNPAYSDTAEVELIPTPEDYRGMVYYLVTDANGNYMGEELTVTAGNGHFYISTNEYTRYNSTYKFYAAILDADGIEVLNQTTALTVRTCKENVEPSVTLKASGAIDLTYPESAAIITPSIKNHSDSFTFADGYVYVVEGKQIVSQGEISEYFDVDVSDGKTIRLTNALINELPVGCTYNVELALDLGGELIWKTAKITVKQTAVNLKLSKSSLSLNKLYGDSAEINVTCSTKNYELDNDKVIVSVMDKTGKNSAADQLDAEYYDGKLYVGVNDETVSGAAYKVLVSADTGYKAAALTVTIPAKSTVTATLKAKGSIDTIRDDAKIVFTPTYKNTISTPLEERIEVYSSDGKKVYEVNGLELTNFDAVSTTKYKAKVVATFENGQKAESPLIAITVKTGTAKMKATGTPTLYLKDKNSRGKFALTSTDLTLNGIDRAVIKDAKNLTMFELYNYGNGQFAIGFKGSKISDAAAKLKTASIPISIWHEGNTTAKPDATVTLKVTIVK